MSKIVTIDFTTDDTIESDEIIEHFKYDKSGDYISLDEHNVVLFHTEFLDDPVSLVNKGDIDNLIKVLQYIKHKHKKGNNDV